MWGEYGIDEFYPGEIYIHEKFSGELDDRIHYIEQISQSIYSYNYEFINSESDTTYLPPSFSLKYQTDYIINELTFKDSVREHDMMKIYISDQSQYQHNYFCYKYDDNTYLIRDRYCITGCYKIIDGKSTFMMDPDRYVEDYADLSWYNLKSPINLDSYLSTGESYVLIPKDILR